MFRRWWPSVSSPDRRRLRPAPPPALSLRRCRWARVPRDEARHQALTPTSNGAGSVLIVVVEIEHGLASGAAKNSPKFDRCASPQHCTRNPGGPGLLLTDRHAHDRGACAIERECRTIIRRCGSARASGHAHRVLLLHAPTRPDVIGRRPTALCSSGTLSRAPVGGPRQRCSIAFGRCPARRMTVAVPPWPSSRLVALPVTRAIRTTLPIRHAVSWPPEAFSAAASPPGCNRRQAPSEQLRDRREQGEDRHPEARRPDDPAVLVCFFLGRISVWPSQGARPRPDAPSPRPVGSGMGTRRPPSSVLARREPNRHRPGCSSMP